MNIELTKDSQKLLTLLYKDYLQKREKHIPKSDANYFGSSEHIHKNLLPDELLEDVAETCRELSRANMIACSWADNHAQNVKISDAGIIYMENRFKNGLYDVVEFLTKFIP